MIGGELIFHKQMYFLLIILVDEEHYFFNFELKLEPANLFKLLYFQRSEFFPYKKCKEIEKQWNAKRIKTFLVTNNSLRPFSFYWFYGANYKFYCKESVDFLTVVRFHCFFLQQLIQYIIHYFDFSGLSVNQRICNNDDK